MTRKRIHIVEDDVSLMDSIAFTLKRHAYETIASTSGKAAIDTMQSSGRECGPVDLLIVDLHLPDMTGLELLRELVRHAKLPPTLVMTPVGSAALREKLKRIGVRECLDMPFDMDELLAKIRAILKP